MTAFALGDFVSLTLDEFDILTVDGQAKLSITPTGHHPYETQTIGHQVVGPFGVVTALTLTGLGAGTYSAGPSNQPLPMVMVDISAAQQASPTAAMLAATSTLFQLNAPPYTIYQSSGTALVAIGGGSGATTAAALTDISTINLPTTNAPLAAALAAAGAPAQSVSYSTVIPLDTPGNGKYMPQTTLNANSTFTVGASPVEGGNCNFSLVGNGTNVPNLTAFVNANSYTFVSTSSANNIYSAVYSYGTPLLYGQLGNPVSILPGQVTGLTAGSATGTTQPLTWTAPATGGVPTDYLVEYRTTVGPGSWTTFSHTASTTAARTVTGLSTGTSYDYRVSAVNGVGTGTASSTVTASTVAIPGQVTGLTAGAVTTSSQVLTWTAPSGTPTDYIVQYRTTAGPGSWVTFSHTASTATTQTVTGLGGSTSYDYQVAATNAAGTGTYSTSVTHSTASAGSLSVTSPTWTGEDLDTAGWTEWIWFRPALDGHQDKSKYGGTLSPSSLVFNSNMSRGNGADFGSNGFGWDGTAQDGATSAASGVTDSGNVKQTATGSLATGYINFPASTGTHHVRLRIGAYNNIAGAGTVRFTLSDGSASEVVVNPQSTNGAMTVFVYEAAYNAGSAGQTLKVQIEMSDTTQGMFPQIYAYKAS